MKKFGTTIEPALDGKRRIVNCGQHSVKEDAPGNAANAAIDVGVQSEENSGPSSTGNSIIGAGLQEPAETHAGSISRKSTCRR